MIMIHHTVPIPTAGQKATVEQTVDFLLSHSDQLLRSDAQVLCDIRHRTWWMGNPITSLQTTKVQSIISRYLLILKNQGWPIQDLYPPVWSTPVRDSIVVEWSITWDSEQDRWILQFPYNKELLRLVRHLSDHLRMYDSLVYDAGRHSWYLQNGVQSRKLLQLLLKQNFPWQCTLELRKQLSQDTETPPTVSYLNGGWKFTEVPEILAPILNQIISRDLPPLQTALALADHAVTFDHRARNYLKNWITADQVGMLCDHDPVITVNQIPDLQNLISQVNVWPVVLEKTRLNHNSVLGLNIPDVKVFRHKPPAELGKENLVNTDDILNILTSLDPVVVEICSGFPVKQIQLPASLRIPWLIQFLGVIESYSVKPDNSHVLYNYNRYLRVVRDKNI
jgi:hypothetical protein